MWLKSAVLLMCAVGTLAASPTIESQILSLMDTAMGRMSRVELAEGVTLVNTSAEAPRSLQGDFGTVLANRISSFLGSHVIRVDLNGTDLESGVRNVGRAISDLAEAVVEPRGKGKKSKMKKPKDVLLPVLIGIKAKMAILTAMAGNMIAVIAGKALLLGKIALILGTMLFLKKLLASPPKEVTYYKHKQIVAPPPEMVHDKGEDWDPSSGTHGRLDYFPQPPYLAAQEMAYSGQMFNAVN